MKLSIIAARAANDAIGAAGKLPWPVLIKDFQHFAKYTNNTTVIMGRKTWESLPANSRPLPNRTCIVITRNGDSICKSQAIVAPDVEQAVEIAKTLNKDITVIGGAEVFRRTLSIADEISLTTVLDFYPEADTFFPPIDRQKWYVVDSHTCQDGNFTLLFEILKPIVRS